MQLTTANDITEGAKQLGIASGDLVCLHVSLSSLGFVPGGVRAVVEGVLQAVDGGTLMMPSYSGDLSDPAEWRYPPAPAGWVEPIREAMPTYDPVRTQTRGMGAVAEYFRTYPGVQRSNHPQSSFTALGPAASDLLHPHPLDNRFGPGGPLGRLKAMDGWVVLLGAPRDTVSLFHMTQHLVGWSKPTAKVAPIMRDGERVWAEYDDIEYPIEWFEDGVQLLLDEELARQDAVSAATTLVFKAEAAVDRIVAWRKQEKR